MRNQRRALSVLALLGCFGVAAPGAAAEPPRKLELRPCRDLEMSPEALCGTYEVFENRAARTGRKIPLKVVVLPATGSNRLPDPFVYFAGGPGEASIPMGTSLTEQLGSLRQNRDALLVDLRGTGKSGGLFCKELKGKEDVQGFLDDFLPADKIRACRDRLQKEADLSWYTTDAAVDDVEEVRTALGYGQLNLMGGSYGTRAVLTYLRRHPQSVRTATLDGVLPPDARYLIRMPRATQQALDGLIRECEADPACRAAFPKLRQETAAVFRQAELKPVQVKLIDPRARRPVDLRLTLSGVAQTLRYMLYSPIEAALVPLQIHQAAQGDWKPLARSAFLHAVEMGSMAEGFYQSVTCAEDVAFVREEEIAAAVTGTFLGDFRIRRQKAACEGWPIRELGPEVEAPVVSGVPALLISGERDPATPPSYGEQAARNLKRARHVVIPDAGHSIEGLHGDECFLSLIAAFVEAGTAEGLDTSCLARLQRPEFELPEVTVARADLEGLPGSYANEEMNLAVKVDLVEDRLRISVTQGLPFAPALLIPTSQTRFRWEGEGLAPGLAVVFKLTDGKATALDVVQPGKPGPVVMKRSDRLALAKYGAFAALAVMGVVIGRKVLRRAAPENG